MSKRIFLVSCVALKAEGPARAADLYRSVWFRKARAYVESHGDDWWILSAKYGLTEPTRVVAPYEQTLNTMPVAERRTWSEQVLRDLRPHLADSSTVVFLAGLRYREFLVPALEAIGILVDIPMEGLRIGEQLSWLGRSETRRHEHLRRFYELLDELSRRTGGVRRLDQGRGPIPRTGRGLYFFFERGDQRSDTGDGSRVTRVGTQALVRGAKSTLWSRLAQHRGRAKSPGGNHRGSVFRLLVGQALIRRDSATSYRIPTRFMVTVVVAAPDNHPVLHPYDLRPNVQAYTY